jgi:phosphatidylserine synthase
MKEKKFFVGLPTPASTIILIVLAFIDVKYFYVFIAIVVISIALISNIKFPKPNIKVNGVATVLIILTIVLAKDYDAIAPILLLTALIIYSIVGPIYLLIKK